MTKDYYKILGIDKSASPEEVKKAFRKMAHQYHPDKGNGNEQKFKEVNEAYQVLGNDKKRKQYDQFGQTFEQSGFAGGQNPFSGFDFSKGFGGFSQGFSDIDIDEIFGDFFGSFGRGRARAGQPARGQDLEIELSVDFKEAVLGTSKKINLTKNIICEICSGSGAKPGSKIDQCSTCKGSGRESHVRQTFLGAIQTQTVCQACQGQGQIIKDKCSQCSGKGFYKGSQEIKVDVPGGVENGQRLRMAGYGEPGLRNSSSGDLFIFIKVNSDKKFERQGDNIYSEIMIPFSLASLGGKTEVEAVDGKISLKIPSGTSSGEQFKLRGKGAKRLGGSRRGDQIVTIRIAVPKKLNNRQKNLIKELEEEGL